jgi:hypothetical protein
MVKWLGKYQEESLNCDSIILATILNPRFRGKFFSIHYPEYDSSANLAIETAFNTVLEANQNQEQSPSPDQGKDSAEEPDAFDIFAASNITDKVFNSELEDYLQGKYPINKDQSPLDWWRVSLFQLF